MSFFIIIFAPEKILNMYKGKIKFYCRSFNKKLYLLSRGLYEGAGYPCVRLTDQTADGYFYTMLRDKDCDIAINVDEDCFITDLNAVLSLAERVDLEGWVNAGCSDSQPACPRGGDPKVTNPFFNVFNLKLIRTKWNEAEMKPQLLKTRLQGIEPYYSFFYWMLDAFPGKTLYLNAHRHQDRISTVIDDLCQHTWFARQYSQSILTRLFEGNDIKDVDHHRRIDAVIDETYRLHVPANVSRPGFGTASRVGFQMDAALRWCHKIPQRIMGWPAKIIRRFVRI